MKKEFWKDIQGFEGLYQISNSGRVRSLNRQVYHNKNKTLHSINGIILSTRINNCGYVEVRLSKNGKQSTRFIHRLIAIAFIPNPQNKRYVNHKDGIKTNNKIDNLEWVSHSENMIHAYKNGLIKRKTRNTNEEYTIQNNKSMSRGRTESRSSIGTEILNCVETGTNNTKKIRRQKFIPAAEKLASLIIKYPRDKHYKWLSKQIRKKGVTKQISQMITWEYENK